MSLQSYHPYVSEANYKHLLFTEQIQPYRNEPSIQREKRMGVVPLANILKPYPLLCLRMNSLAEEACNE